MVRLALAAAALLVTTLCCYIGTSYAVYSVDVVPNHAAEIGDEGGVELNAAAAGGPPVLAAGDKYRPPIINLKYRGGPILWKPIRLYFVWYGTWTEAQKKVVRTACKSLTPAKKIQQYPNLSNYWSLVMEYYQQLPGEVRKYASNQVSVAGELNDKYSMGRNISGKYDPIRIIRSHIGKGLPKDLEQGVYFVFASKDVGNSDPQELKTCGYHSSQCYDLTKSCKDHLNHLVYSFVPLYAPGCNAFGTKFLKGAPPNRLVSPNGDLDSMIKTIFHELTELTIDPYPYIRFPDGINLQNVEVVLLCSRSYVAGDWWYCDAPKSLYPDFTGGATCSSDSLHRTALTDTSKTIFNIYGIDGSRFLVDQFWSLAHKGCVLQPEAACPKTAVVLRLAKGTIKRGLFVNGVGLQHYAPGQNCTWVIIVHWAKSLNLYFEKVALGFDALDSVKVFNRTVLTKTVTGFGKNIKVIVLGNQAIIRFSSYGGKAPYPSSAGFILHYTAVL